MLHTWAVTVQAISWTIFRYTCLALNFLTFFTVWCRILSKVGSNYSIFHWGQILFIISIRNVWRRGWKLNERSVVSPIPVHIKLPFFCKWPLSKQFVRRIYINSRWKGVIMLRGYVHDGTFSRLHKLQSVKNPPFLLQFKYIFFF